MFQINVVEKIKTHILCLIMFYFRESCRLWDRAAKYFRGGQATDKNMAHAHCMLDILVYKHTLRILIVFFTARMVAGTRLNFNFIRNAAWLVSFYHGATAPNGPGPPHIEASLSHANTPQSVGILWTTDQPDAETSSWQHTTLITDIHGSRGIRTRYPSKLEAADPRLWPRDKRDRSVVHNRKMQIQNHS